MANESIDPEKAAKIVRLGIAILTAILGFLTGMGSANAANIIMSNL